MNINPFKSIAEEVKSASIEMCANKRMVITDCKYVVDYSKEYIVLNIGKLNIKVRGEELLLSGFSYGETCIEGEIISVEFEKN